MLDRFMRWVGMESFTTEGVRGVGVTCVIAEQKYVLTRYIRYIQGREGATSPMLDRTSTDSTPQRPSYEEFLT